MTDGAAEHQDKELREGRNGTEINLDSQTIRLEWGSERCHQAGGAIARFEGGEGEILFLWNDKIHERSDFHPP